LFTGCGNLHIGLHSTDIAMHGVADVGWLVVGWSCRLAAGQMELSVGAGVGLG